MTYPALLPSFPRRQESIGLLVIVPYEVDLDDVAAANGWADLLSPAIQDLVKIDGKYMAAPVNIHRIDWLWISPSVLEKAGAEVPTTWEEFFEAAKKVQDAGMIALAHGGQNWQDITMFETVALGVGGPDFYRQAFVEFSADAMKSEEMANSLATFRRLSEFTDKDSPGRAWNETTAMLIRGEAAFQIMGDWVKGEFSAANLEAGKDYLCVDVPETQNAYIYNTDSFGMFKLSDDSAIAAQKDLAKAIMLPGFQRIFNLYKGSIPVRNDVDMNEFDSCAQTSVAHLAAADAAGGTVPSIAHGMATTTSNQGAVRDVITQFWNQPSMTVAEAQERLANVASNTF